MRWLSKLFRTLSAAFRTRQPETCSFNPKLSYQVRFHQARLSNKENES